MCGIGSRVNMSVSYPGSYSGHQDMFIVLILIKNFPVLCQWHDLVKLNYKIGMILVACWSPLQAGKLDNIKSEVGIC